MSSLVDKRHRTGCRRSPVRSLPYPRLTTLELSSLVKVTVSCVFTIVIILRLSPGRLACPTRKAVTVGRLKRGVGASAQGRAAPTAPRAVRSGIEERISHNSAQRRLPVVPDDMRVPPTAPRHDYAAPPSHEPWLAEVSAFDLGVGVLVVRRADDGARAHASALDEGAEHLARELGVLVHHQHVGEPGTGPQSTCRG